MTRYLNCCQVAEAVQLPPRIIRSMVKAGHVRTWRGERDPDRARLTVKAWRDFVYSLQKGGQERAQ